MTKIIRFDASKEDTTLLLAILKRARAMAKELKMDIDLLSLHMDITACHLNGCPLRLQALLDADDFNFGHDVFGIRNCIDRETGTLTRGFLPRFNAL